MAGYGQLLGGVNPAALSGNADGSFCVVDLSSGKNLGVNSNGDLYLSMDNGVDQRWTKGTNVLMNVNKFEGTKYFFLEWFN